MQIVRHLIFAVLCLFPLQGYAGTDWEVKLTVKSGNAYNRLVLGTEGTATDSYDPLWDTYALMGGTVQAYFSHPEWGLTHQEFHRDIRSHNPGASIEWSMTVNSSLVNNDFTVSWDISSVSENNPVVLIDETTGQQTDMRSSSSYTFTYTAPRSFRITVTENTGCANLPVRIDGASPVYYSTLQEAYNAAQSGDTIQSRTGVFNESFSMNLDKDVAIIGGFDCTYSDAAGQTTLSGSLTISNGNAALENIVLQ